MPPVPFYLNHPDSPESSGVRYFAILPVTVVTRGRTGARTFTSSLDLFRCLQRHGERGNVITGMTANGLSLAVQSLSTLNTYLRLHSGLNAFWRLSRAATRGTKYQWQEFSLFLNFTWEAP